MTKNQTKKHVPGTTLKSLSDSDQHAYLENLKAQAEVNMRVYYFIQNHLIKDSNLEIQAESAILAKSFLEKANSIKKILSGE